MTAASAPFPLPGPWGLGTAQLGNLYRATTPENAAWVVDAAWAAGVRWFDTAPHYGLGLSEQRAGAALRGRPRDEFVLSTKVGRLLVPNPGHEGEQDASFAVPATTRREWDFSRDGVRRSIDESLARLGLDRIDVVYVHDPDDFGDQVLAEALPALIELRGQGVVRAVGVGMNQSALPARFVAESDLDLVMLAGRYTLLEQGALDDLLPLALERGVGVVAAGAYNSGLLARDRPAADARYDYAPAPAGAVARAHRLADVCEAHGVPLPTAALAFPLRHPAVVSVAVGCETPEQVTQTAERLATPIPEGLWSDLAAEGLVRD
ncbi:aldo/keto reductase [Myceligenerans crystallogenes]|uniref:Aldo/keto reductase n=1 Tax=Myceligenerans crystallogenes TaxID=316335 RepID=A0ABP4ZWQ9_9MICO